MMAVPFAVWSREDAHAWMSIPFVVTDKIYKAHTGNLKNSP